MDSILTSIKKMIGIEEADTTFDGDIIVHINTVFMTLKQIAVGPKEGFYIEDNSATWEEYIPDPVALQAVKSYMYLKVKLLFDPPQSSAVMESMNRQASELEWRLNADADVEDTTDS